jgi:CHAD domain-containing protein
VHDVRKRCKEVRAVARLVRSSLGEEFDRFNNLVGDAADCLSPIRDAHAVLGTLDDLRRIGNGDAAANLDRVRAGQVALADAATRGVRGNNRRIRTARRQLVAARKLVKGWELPNNFGPIDAGIRRSYRRGRRALATARDNPTDEHLHEWRKAVKTLWYQLRLIERCAPSVLTPLIATLDDLAEALGDDHDLAVLVERVAGDPAHFGGVRHAMQAIDVARTHQDELRRRAFRLGGTVYAERPSAFSGRIERYWRLTLRHGPELVTGGLDEIDDDAENHEQRLHAPDEEPRQEPRAASA